MKRLGLPFGIRLVTLPSFLVLVALLSSCSCASAEQREYSHISSHSEREAFQQSVDDLRSQGLLVNINFGKQPPYQGARPSGIRLENNRSSANPTWDNLIAFLKADQTDTHAYFPGVYSCGEFAQTLHNNAEEAGIRCAFVAVDLAGDTIGHALNAFFTTDMGWVYINSMGRNPLEAITSSPLEMALDPFKDWSQDCVAYVALGQELGFIHVSCVESLGYDFYQDWKNRYQAFDLAVDHYGRDVQAYNDRVRGRVFYAGTPEAEAVRIRGAELDIQLLTLREESLALGPMYEPMGFVIGIDVYF